MSKRRVQEHWIKEINAEEHSGEKGADRRRKEGSRGENREIERGSWGGGRWEERLIVL